MLTKLFATATVLAVVVGVCYLIVILRRVRLASNMMPDDIAIIGTHANSQDVRLCIIDYAHQAGWRMELRDDHNGKMVLELPGNMLKGINGYWLFVALTGVGDGTRLRIGIKAKLYAVNSRMTALRNSATDELTSAIFESTSQWTHAYKFRALGNGTLNED